MKKYTINIGATTVIDSLSRNTSAQANLIGVRLNSSSIYNINAWESRSFLPNAFNNPSLYIRNRRVNILPESTESNTVITNDGLVGVIYNQGGVNYLTVLDLIESENTVYAHIAPIDYALLANYNELTNPANKRIFICNGIDQDLDLFYTLRTTHKEIYRKNGYVYFESEMDYPINRPIDNSTMENGYYRTTEANWAAINPTTNFQFLKKQFFRIEGPSDLKVTIEDANVTMDSPAPGIIRLRYLDIDLDTADSFINFQFKTASNYCSITVY